MTVSVGSRYAASHQTCLRMRFANRKILMILVALLFFRQGRTQLLCIASNGVSRYHISLYVAVDGSLLFDLGICIMFA